LLELFRKTAKLLKKQARGEKRGKVLHRKGGREGRILMGVEEWGGWGGPLKEEGRGDPRLTGKEVILIRKIPQLEGIEWGKY